MSKNGTILTIGIFGVLLSIFGWYKLKSTKNKIVATTETPQNTEDTSSGGGGMGGGSSGSTVPSTEQPTVPTQPTQTTQQPHSITEPLPIPKPMPIPRRINPKLIATLSTKTANLSMTGGNDEFDMKQDDIL